MIIQFKRGLKAAQSALTTLLGEPIVATDTQELFIGDGGDTGGFAVGTVKSDATALADTVAVFDGDSKRVLKGISKESLVPDNATKTWVTNELNTKVPDIEVKLATKATASDDSAKLGGKASADYLTKDNLTASTSENDPSKVVSADGIATYTQTTDAAIMDIRAKKIDKASITSSLTSTDATKVPSAPALALVNTKADTAVTQANLGVTNASKAAQDAATAKTSVSSLEGVVKAEQAKSVIVKDQSDRNTAQLNNLPKAIHIETTTPTAQDGVNGDVWLQY